MIQVRQMGRLSDESAQPEEGHQRDTFAARGVLLAQVELDIGPADRSKNQLITEVIRRDFEGPDSRSVWPGARCPEGPALVRKGGDVVGDMIDNEIEGPWRC